MKFTILKENLVRALNIVGRSISTKPQLPILSYLLFKAEKNELTISATNLETGIIYTCAAKIEENGVVAIPGKLLQEYVSSLTADNVEFETKETSLWVKSSNTKASFATMSPTDFPPFVSVPPQEKKLSLLKLKDAILRSVFAASIDDSRPVLTGIKLSVSEGKITLCATDGYRLSTESVDVADKKEEFKVILPATSLQEVVRIAQEVKAQEIGFSIVENKNQVVFTLPQIHLFTRLIDGEFPNVEKIIPLAFKTKATINRDELLQAVKTASLFARGAANIIKIKVEKTGLRLSANTPQVGSNEDFVEAKVEGEETEMAFNFRFLLDILSHFPETEVVLESSGSLNPGVFKPASSQSSFLHLIMPVRVQS